LLRTIAVLADLDGGENSPPFFLSSSSCLTSLFGVGKTNPPFLLFIDVELNSHTNFIIILRLILKILENNLSFIPGKSHDEPVESLHTGALQASSAQAKRPKTT
jgi:hypothetical protein